MQTLLQDLRYGVRMLMKKPGFTLIVVLTLALGIGANTTIFSTAESLILHPFSYANQDRLVMVYQRKPELNVQRFSMSPGNLHDLKTNSQTFEQFVTMHVEDFTLTGVDKPDQFEGYKVSAEFFTALGVQPLIGRVFHSGEDTAGNEQVAVLKHSLWQRRFGADPNIIGQTITLNGKAFNVVGVMPEGFNFPYNGGELWTPNLMAPESALDHDNYYLRVFGLVKSGISIAQANTEIVGLSQRAQQQFPATNKGIEAYVVGLNEDFTRGSRMYLTFMLGAVAFVLLIACANVANLLLVRGSTRQKEIGIRMALGASRWRLIRQLLTESILLSLAGGALGLGLAVWGLAALAHGIPEGFSQFIPGWDHLAINNWALGFTLLVSLVTGIIFGLMPALQATQSNFNEALKEGSRGTTGGARNRLRNVLVVSEVALSLVLLVGAGLLIRSFIAVLNTDYGIKPDNTISMRIVLPPDRYEKSQRIYFYEQFLSRIKTLPGVMNVGAVDNLPMGGSNNGSDFQIAGQPPFTKAAQPFVDTRIVTPEYFAAIGTSLHRGRLITPQDTAESPAVLLVNESFAARYFPGRNAIGERLEFVAGKPVSIVGIVANVMNDDMDNPAEPMVYQPFAQRVPNSMALVVRGQTEVTNLVSAIRQELAALDPNLPLSNVKTIHQTIHERSSPKRVVTIMLGIMALLALVLAAVGLYAVMSFTVAQRTHEIGIRMALGAQARDVFQLVVGQGLKLVFIGIFIGLIGAFALTRVLAQVLFGITATDPLTFAAVALLLAIAAFFACWIPARRATKVDPMIALRVIQPHQSIFHAHNIRTKRKMAPDRSRSCSYLRSYGCTLFGSDALAGDG